MDPDRDVACCEELWQSWTDTGDIALYEDGWILTPGRDLPIRFCPFCGKRLPAPWIPLNGDSMEEFAKANERLITRYDKTLREHQDKVNAMEASFRSSGGQGSSDPEGSRSSSRPG